MKNIGLPGIVSIRSRLLLLLILSVMLTALAISLVTVFLGFRDARNRVEGQLSSVVALKQQEIASWTSGLQLNLDLVLSGGDVEADLAELSSMAPLTARASAYDRLREQFLWAAERMDLFEEVFYMDAKGTVLISTNTGHENQRLGLNDFFVEGMKGSYIEQPSYSLSLDKMTIVASTPVVDRDRVIGVLAGRADLTGLNEIMIERAGLGQTGETYLVGSNHRLLTYLRRPDYSIPDTYIRTAGTDAAIDGQLSGAGSYEGYAGKDVIGVYAWIPDLSVGLIAEQEEGEALRPTQIVLVTMGGVAILAVALAILAGFMLTRTIVGPLEELGETAGRIAGGELELRARVVRGDEIGHLAHSFNRMTSRLSELVHNLERRSDDLRAINDTGRQMSSILDMDQLLAHVARSLLQTFAYQTVHILLLNDDAGRRPSGEALVGGAADDLEDRDAPGVLLTYRRENAAPARVRFDEQAAAEYPAIAEAAGGEVPVTSPMPPRPLVQTAGSAEIAVPIRVADDAVGVLAITAGKDDGLDEQDLFVAQTLADQLAIAIQNSRLYEHARDLAASQERQRLARDLHDAASQTLFSVSLIAEVLPRIYQRDPEQAAARLEELRQLTRGALAEMRTLLLELRPAALAEANLPDLLKQLAEAVTGRSRIPIGVETELCLDLPKDVRIAFYRIAQEALNNIAKHSGATRATVRLICGDALTLLVEDDGAGFDAAAGSSGQLGLGIMRERAESVGAQVSVESNPGQGTRVRVDWTPSA